MKNHYVYRITNLDKNKHYYGVRSTKSDPKNDLGIKYFSSSTDKDFIKDQKENSINYKYKVLFIFNSRAEATKMEMKLHNKFDVAVNESFYNKCKQTSTGYDRTGMPGVKHDSEVKKRIANSVSKTKRELSPTIYQYDLDGVFLRSFEVISDTVDFFGVASAISNVKKCLEHKHRKYKDSLWRYEKLPKISPYKPPSYKWFHNPDTKEHKRININSENWEQKINNFLPGPLKETCPYCGKSGNFNAMRKKHFHNCPQKQQKDS